MKQPIAKVFTWVVLLGAGAWWMFIFFTTTRLPPVDGWMRAKAPFFYRSFHNSWRLFSPPPLGNHRLYLFVKEAGEPTRIDTLELLKSLNRRKRITAPFNQASNIEDHLLNKQLFNLEKALHAASAIPYVPTATTGLKDAKLQQDIQSIYAYATWVLKRQYAVPSQAFIKIRLTKIVIPPMNSVDAGPEETLIAELPYKRLP